MRPQFRVIFTVSLGKPWLWAQSKAGIRSVAPFFMKAAAASEPELSTVLRQIGRHTGLQTRPDAKAIGKRACGAPSAICKIPILFCWDLNEIAPSQDQDRRTGQVECISPGPAGLARILVVFPRRRDCTGL